MPSSVPLEGQLCTASFIGEVRDVRTLLGSRADVSESDKGGDTPLHLAAVGGYVEVGRMLIEANADVGVRDKFGLSPLHTAA
jgi:ankyrin repeat protein